MQFCRSRPSSDARKLHINPQSSITSPGDQTVPAEAVKRSAEERLHAALQTWLS